MPEPTPVKQRVESMDMLRGVAVLGILLININSFALPIDAMTELSAEGYHHVVDAWVFALVGALGSGKFMSMFAMLFGAGVAMMVDGRRQQGVPTAGVHYRRLAVLGALGFLHGTLIWYGDILLPYAICGALLYPLLLLSPRKLVWVCAVLWLIAIVAMLGFGVMMVWAESMAAEGESSTRIFENEVELMRGGVLSIMKVRLVHWLVIMLIGPFITMPWVMALMVTGVLAKRHGWMTGQRPRRDYRRLLAWGTALGLPIAICRVVLGFLPEAQALTAAIMPMNMIDATLLAMAWGAIVMLIAQAGLSGVLGRALVAVGRMSLTNYLAQSILCTLLFYGYGFGLFGSLSRTALLGVVACIWVLQLSWSPWWLRRYERGPVEAVWRRLTYSKPPQDHPHHAV